MPLCNIPPHGRKTHSVSGLLSAHIYSGLRSVHFLVFTPVKLDLWVSLNHRCVDSVDFSQRPRAKSITMNNSVFRVCRLWGFGGDSSVVADNSHEV